MFEDVVRAPSDPILGLTDAFARDERQEKVNLGVGVYRDDTGKTPVMRAVKRAEKVLLDEVDTKSYLPIEGARSFGEHARELLFGVSDTRTLSAQTPGGTGALRVAADFLKQQKGPRTVWLSSPTWANHPKIFAAAGHETKEFPWYDAAAHRLDEDALVSALEAVPAGDVVLLHGCCHNPTGFDPSDALWDKLANLASDRGWLPLFDVAYQGLGRGLDDDVAGLRTFAAKVPELLVAQSFSKNFGLYSERAGALTVRAEDAEVAANAFSQIRIAIRTNYSNPPRHAGSIVHTVLESDELTTLWREELEQMRTRIASMRMALAEALQGAARDFSFLRDQRGMFSYTGLSTDEVDALREQDGIYMVRSGRINVAGLNRGNLEKVSEAIRTRISA